VYKVESSPNFFPANIKGESAKDGGTKSRIAKLNNSLSTLDDILSGLPSFFDY
jgi:hypothetical protein